ARSRPVGSRTVTLPQDEQPDEQPAHPDDSPAGHEARSVAAVSHHVAVARTSFDDDPPTADVQGDRHTPRHPAKGAAALFRALNADERVSWALLSAGKRPLVGAVTDSRLLLFPLTDPNAEPRVLVAPYTFSEGKKKLLGHQVTVLDARGTQAELLL